MATIDSFSVNAVEHGVDGRLVVRHHPLEHGERLGRAVHVQHDRGGLLDRGGLPGEHHLFGPENLRQLFAGVVLAIPLQGGQHLDEYADVSRELVPLPHCGSWAPRGLDDREEAVDDADAESSPAPAEDPVARELPEKLGHLTFTLFFRHVSHCNLRWFGTL